MGPRLFAFGFLAECEAGTESDRLRLENASLGYAITPHVYVNTESGWKM